MCTRVPSQSEKSAIYNSRVSRVLRSLGVEMSSLCPHQFEQYLKKVAEILDTYKPQILACVKYKDICESLQRQKVLRRRDHADIVRVVDSAEQMGMVLHIVKKKMWGLENFMTALIDGNKETWLSEELFQAYVRHLVTNMKKLQSQPVCDCFHGGRNSVLYRSWLRALESFDGYLYQIGTSLGFLTQTIRPVNGVLDFIRNKLPIARQKIVTVTQCDAESSDSEEEEQEEFEWDAGGDLQDFVDADQSLGPPSTETVDLAEVYKSEVNANPKISTSKQASVSVQPTKAPIKRENIGGQPKTSTGSSSSSTRPPRSSTATTSKKSNQPKVVAVPRKKVPESSKNKSTIAKCNSKAAPVNKILPSEQHNVATATATATATDLETSQDDEINSNLYLPNTSFYSISLSTGSEAELDDDLNSVEGLKSNDQKMLADLDDDDAFLPQPAESTTPAQADLSPAQQILRKHKINRESRNLENSTLVSGLEAIKSPAEILNQTNYENKLKAETFSKPVQTISSSTQTIFSESDSVLKLEPEAEPVEKSTVCTQTTPPTSPTRARRSNSFPTLLSKEIGFYSHQSSAFSLNPNVFQTELETQKKEIKTELNENDTVETGVIAARSGRARIIKPFDDPNPKKSEGLEKGKDKKPFLKKQSGHTSTMRKISSAISSAVSSLKPSSSSEKKIARALSTSSATPAKAQTKSLARSASVSTSTSTTKTPRDHVPPRKLPSTLPSGKGKSTTTTVTKSTPLISANIAKPVVKPAPTIPLRQRVHAEIRETKANAPPPPPVTHQERLSPNDYNLQQLSNAWAAKQQAIEHPEQNNNHKA